MLRPSRATLVVGLSLLGALGLVAPSFGQQKDAGVRPAATPPGTTPAAPALPKPLMIGSIDLDKVLKEYDKFKVANETIRAESLQRYEQLMKLANEGKAEQEKLGRFAPSSPDHQRSLDRITQVKAQIEALRENSQREFTQKEAETMATIYNEIADMAKAVAKQRSLTFIVKVSDAPAAGSEPDSVVAAMSRTILYSDPSVDITGDVIAYLNHYYRQSGAPAPKTTSAVPPAGQRTSPAGQVTTPASQPATQRPTSPTAPVNKTATAPTPTGRN